jgi:hypothetical protein
MEVGISFPSPHIQASTETTVVAIIKSDVSQNAGIRCTLGILRDALKFEFVYKTYFDVKVKVTPEQATKAQRGSRGIALLFS